MGWVIEEDIIDGGSAFGKTEGNYKGGKHKYRLKDDDNEVYYIIKSDTDPNEGTEEEIFDPLNWAQGYAGCTEIEYWDEEKSQFISL